MMYYFFKWLAKQWANTFNSVVSGKFISKFFNKILDGYLGFSRDTGIFLFALLHLMWYFVMGAGIFFSVTAVKISLLVFALHMFLVYLAIQYRKYQLEMEETLRILKD